MASSILLPAMRVYPQNDPNRPLNWDEYLKEQFQAPEPMPMPEDQAPNIPAVMQPTIEGPEMPSTEPGQMSAPVPPQPAATLEDILGNRLRKVQDEAQAKTAQGLAFANINTDISRAFSPIVKTPIDPSAGAGARALAQLPMQRAEQERQTLLRQYAADKEREKMALGTKRTDALRAYAASKGIVLPEGMSEESAMGLLGQEGTTQRSQAAIASNLELADRAQQNSNEQRQLDRQNRLDIAMMRRKNGAAGTGGGGGGKSIEALERAGVPREDAAAAKGKTREQVLAQVMKDKARAADTNLNPTETVALRMLGQQYGSLIPLRTALADANRNIQSIRGNIKGIGGINLMEGDLGPFEPEWMRSGRIAMGSEGAAEAKSNRNIVENIMDLIRRARSGAAITEQEEVLYNRMLNTSIGGTDEEFRRAVQRITDEISAKVENTIRATPQNVVDYYNRSTQVGQQGPDPQVPDMNPATSVSAPKETDRYQEQDDETGDIRTVIEYSDGSKKILPGVQ